MHELKDEGGFILCPTCLVWLFNGENCESCELSAFIDECESIYESRNEASSERLANRCWNRYWRSRPASLLPLCSATIVTW